MTEEASNDVVEMDQANENSDKLELAATTQLA